MVNDGKPQSGSISMYLLQCLIEQGLSSSAHTAGMHDSSWLYKPLMNNTILGLLGNSSDEVSIEIIGDHPQSHVGGFLHPSKPRVERWHVSVCRRSVGFTTRLSLDWFKGTFTGFTMAFTGFYVFLPSNIGGSCNISLKPIQWYLAWNHPSLICITVSSWASVNFLFALRNTSDPPNMSLFYGLKIPLHL